MLINDEIQRQVMPMIVKATTATPGGDAELRSASQLQINPGQQVKAEIIANLPNHMYLARIAGELFHIELPILVEPGQTMNLTFVTADPRLTFQFAPAKGGETIQFTSLGKWLSSTVQDAPPLPQPEPLLEGPPLDGAQLAARLKGALVHGGLFYEAHLAEWTAGNLAVSELLAEPQGKLSRLGAKDDREIAREHEYQEGAGAPFADGSTLSLVKEQLSLLTTGMFAWRGEAWPGQDMELIVSGERGEDGGRSVQANLSVELPRLGKVDALLSFGTEGLSVELCCDRPESAQLLKEEGAELRSALSLSGVHLGRMAVRDAQRGE